MAATGQFMCQYCLYVLQLRTTVNTVLMVVHAANVYCPFHADGYRWQRRVYWGGGEHQCGWHHPCQCTPKAPICDHSTAIQDFLFHYNVTPYAIAICAAQFLRKWKIARQSAPDNGRSSFGSWSTTARCAVVMSQQLWGCVFVFPLPFS